MHKQSKNTICLLDIHDGGVRPKPPPSLPALNAPPYWVSTVTGLPSSYPQHSSSYVSARGRFLLTLFFFDISWAPPQKKSEMMVVRKEQGIRSEERKGINNITPSNKPDHICEYLMRHFVSILFLAHYFLSSIGSSTAQSFVRHKTSHTSNSHRRKLTQKM